MVGEKADIFIIQNEKKETETAISNNIYKVFVFPARTLIVKKKTNIMTMLKIKGKMRFGSLAGVVAFPLSYKDIIPFLWNSKRYKSTYSLVIAICEK